MRSQTKFALVAIPAAAFGFLLQSHAPIGNAIWPADPAAPEPEGAPLVALMIMGGLSAVTFGVGVAWFVLAMPAIRRFMDGPAAWAVYLSIGWFMVNWVPHEALHMAVGNIESAGEYAALAGIEYGFHLTLIVAGFLLAALATGIWPTAAPGGEA